MAVGTVMTSRSMPFAEGAFAILPDEWQSYCLDWAYLKTCLENCTLNDAALPLSDTFSDQLPANKPQLPASLQDDLRHIKFAELVVAELNLALAFITNERRKCATDLAAVETLAASYIQGAQRARLNNGGGEGGGGEQDPYVRNRLKNALVYLYHEHARHVTFRMLNHGVVCKLARLQADLVVDSLAAGNAPAPVPSLSPQPSRFPVSGDGRAANGAATAEVVEKELVVFALSHELFSGMPQFSTGSAPGDSAATTDLLGLGGGEAAVVPKGAVAVAPSGSAVELPEEAPVKKGVGSSPLLREEEISTLYAVLFCHGDLEVARAALTYYSPEGGASILSAPSSARAVVRPVLGSNVGSFRNLVELMARPARNQRHGGPVGSSGSGLAVSLSGEVIIG